MADIALPNHGDPNWDSPLNAAIEAVNADVETKADDSTVVHKTGDEAIAGTKTFAVAPVVPDASFPIAKTAGLRAALDGAGGGGIGAIDTVHARYAVDLNGNPYLAARPTGVTEGAMAHNDRSIVIGAWTTEATADYGIAIGIDAKATIGSSSFDRFALAVGTTAIASGNSATAVGPNAQALKNYAVALGSQAEANAVDGVAIGSRATASQNGAISIGSEASTSAAGAIAIGIQASSPDDSAIAVGAYSAAAEEAEALGYRASAQGVKSVAIGSGSKATSRASVSLGEAATTYAPHSAAFFPDDSHGVILREHFQVNARDLHVARRDRYAGDTVNPYPNDPHDDYARNSQSGVVVHSPNGSAWRIAVDDSGTLTATAVSLPTAPRWPRVNPIGEPGWASIACSSDGTKAAAIADGGSLYLSTNSGTSWTIKSGAGTSLSTSVLMSADGTKILADNKKSTDSGTTWSTVTFPQGGTAPQSIAAKPDLSKVLIVNGGRLYVSTDLGATWTQIHTGLVEDGSGTSLDTYFKSISMSGDGASIVANISHYSNEAGQIYTSTDAGVTWTLAGNAPSSSLNASTFAMSPTGFNAIGITTSGTLAIGDLAVGTPWPANALGAPASSFGMLVHANSVSRYVNGFNSKWISADPDAGIYVSDDGYTAQYVQASAGAWLETGFTCCAISGDGSRVFAATNTGYIYTSALPLAAA